MDEPKANGAVEIAPLLHAADIICTQFLHPGGNLHALTDQMGMVMGGSDVIDEPTKMETALVGALVYSILLHAESQAMEDDAFEALIQNIKMIRPRLRETLSSLSMETFLANSYLGQLMRGNNIVPNLDGSGASLMTTTTSNRRH